MANTPTALKVTALIKEPIEAAGYTLWDVRFIKEGASWYLRVFIDKDEGININDCVDVTHLIDPIIDDADPINVSYCLEVCSPGIDRELTEDWHFEKHINSTVTVKLIRPRDKMKEFCGTLLAFDGGVTLKTDDGELYFAKSEIVNVRLSDADFN